MEKRQNLYKDLCQYLEKGLYPFHMPGHKRNVDFLRNPIFFDMTEVSGTDDLHHPEGILKASMERTARVFGSDRTWYLVNGSTCGNLAGISSICPLNGELIVARNCHRSVFHALELRNITPHWVYPGFDEDYGILTDISPESVKKLLEKYPESHGVVITSPTYEGVVSDVRAIAEICHSHGVPLLVDEAHGAHLGLVESAGFPESAIRCGADLVVQSAHKTLIGLNQTALLHMKSELINPKTIERNLDIFETSSPSYILMLSLDACTEMILEKGEEVFSGWSHMLAAFDEGIKGLRHFKVLCHGDDCLNNHNFFSFDKSKILINFSNTHFSGETLTELMREKYHFEFEMQQGENLLAMTGPGDEEAALIRLAEALGELDREEDDLRQKNPDAKVKDSPILALYNCTEAEQAVTLQEAVEAEAEEVAFSDAENRISAEYVYCYPPGIPMIVPGERLSSEKLNYIKTLILKGYELHFSGSHDSFEIISCSARPCI